MKKIITSALSIAAVLSMTGCQLFDSQEPEDYSTRSHVDYKENTYGLVDATFAAKLITNWQENKPEGKRKLFVMQYGNIYGFEGTHMEPISATETAEFGNGYIVHDEEAGVYVFDRTLGCTTTGDYRGDGVSSVPKPVYSLAQMDAAFAAYGIDPEQDVLLLVLGSADAKGSYMAGVARMWYTLTYWGMPQESIMIMSGQATNVLDPEHNSEIAALGITREDIFTDLPTPPAPHDDWKSIANIATDGTILQATMGDMMTVIDNNLDTDLIIDARSEAEYDGEKAAKTEYKVCGENKDEQCYTAFDGHMKGAKNLYFTNILNTEASEDVNGDGVTDYKDAPYTFKSLEEMDALFTAVGYNAGDTVYTYCRTGTKASLLTFASSAVLGYKTRMYDGSWIQWGKMANATDVNGDTLVPQYSPWRTDLSRYSEVVIYNSDSSKVSPQNKDYLNPYALHTEAIILEDKLAKYED